MAKKSFSYGVKNGLQIEDNADKSTVKSIQHILNSHITQTIILEWEFMEKGCCITNRNKYITGKIQERIIQLKTFNTKIIKFFFLVHSVTFEAYN